MLKNTKKVDTKLKMSMAWKNEPRNIFIKNFMHLLYRYLPLNKRPLAKTYGAKIEKSHAIFVPTLFLPWQNDPLRVDGE